jgi:threonine-phosphate decarboxylase
MVFGHGDDIYRYGSKIKYNFSSNIPVFADLSGLKAHLAERLDVISSYPEPEARRLEELIAAEEGITPQQVLVTAGATEAIYLIAQLYRDYVSIIPQPTFNEYADAAMAHGHMITYHNEELDYVPGKRLFWICNPNNPTGYVLQKTLISYIIRHQRENVFVVDQSYEDYTLQPVLKTYEMQDCHNVILLHSMTKRYCIPGLRLGYITASPIIIDRLRMIRQPWTVNALAIEAGEYLVKNHIEVIPDRNGYLEEASRLHEQLNQLNGLMLMDSEANFMLGYLENSSARELKQWLIDHYGILIRDASNFHGLDSNSFRVAAQTPEQNVLLVEAIREFLDTLPFTHA